jgi:hypothetical protein
MYAPPKTGKRMEPFPPQRGAHAPAPDRSPAKRPLRVPQRPAYRYQSGSGASHALSSERQNAQRRPEPQTARQRSPTAVIAPNASRSVSLPRGILGGSCAGTSSKRQPPSFSKILSVASRYHATSWAPSLPARYAGDGNTPPCTKPVVISSWKPPSRFIGGLCGQQILD